MHRFQCEAAIPIISTTIIEEYKRPEAQRFRDRVLIFHPVGHPFITVIERANTLKKPKAAVGWIRQIAVNQCLMRLRSPWQQRRDEFAAGEEVDPTQPGPREENLRDLEQALLRLGPETRMVLWLHDVEGYTHKEIAQVFGRTESYSKSQLARGYEKLTTNEAKAESAGDWRRSRTDAAGNNPGGRDDGLAKAAPACLS